MEDPSTLVLPDRSDRRNTAGLQKHHYIPVFYLKQWAGPDGRLCEFSRPYTLRPEKVMPPNVPVKPRMKYPDGTGYARGLYTFDTLPPAVANLLEQHFLQRADDLAYSALCRLLENRFNFDNDTRSAWSRFIMTLLHRTPEAIDRIVRKIVADYPSYLEESLGQTFGSWAAGVPELSVGDIERLTLHGLHKVMDSEFLGSALNNMLWAVICFDETHHPLLTSDRPIMMTNGLAQPDAHLAMPISPRRVFVAANTQEEVKRLEDMARSAGLAQRINNRMARQARKYVWGINDAALRFIEGRLGEKAPWSPLE